MMSRPSDEMDQRAIDHEVRLTELRERRQRYATSRGLLQERESGRADRRWYRRELIAMLTAAQTEADLHGLGLSDDVVREAGLGESLVEAWTRFRPHRPLPVNPAA